MNNNNRPLDSLNEFKERIVLVDIKDSDRLLEGKLISFDIHINLVLEIKGKRRFVRGERVVYIEEKEVKKEVQTNGKKKR